MISRRSLMLWSRSWSRASRQRSTGWRKRASVKANHNSVIQARASTIHLTLNSRLHHILLRLGSPRGWTERQIPNLRHQVVISQTILIVDGSKSCFIIPKSIHRLVKWSKSFWSCCHNKWLVRPGRLNPEFAPLRDVMARELNLKFQNMAVAYDIATQMAQVIISLHYRYVIS